MNEVASGSPVPDMGGYIERAQRLATGAGLQRLDAYFPPGTHMLLAARIADRFGLDEPSAVSQKN